MGCSYASGCSAFCQPACRTRPNCNIPWTELLGSTGRRVTRPETRASRRPPETTEPSPRFFRPLRYGNAPENKRLVSLPYTSLGLWHGGPLVSRQQHGPACPACPYAVVTAPVSMPRADAPLLGTPPAGRWLHVETVDRCSTAWLKGEARRLACLGCEATPGRPPRGRPAAAIVSAPVPWQDRRMLDVNPRHGGIADAQQMSPVSLATPASRRYNAGAKGRSLRNPVSSLPAQASSGRSQSAAPSRSASTRNRQRRGPTTFPVSSPFAHPISRCHHCHGPFAIPGPKQATGWPPWPPPDWPAPPHRDRMGTPYTLSSAVPASAEACVASHQIGQTTSQTETPAVWAESPAAAKHAEPPPPLSSSPAAAIPPMDPCLIAARRRCNSGWGAGGIPRVRSRLVGLGLARPGPGRP